MKDMNKLEIVYVMNNPVLSPNELIRHVLTVLFININIIMPKTALSIFSKIVPDCALKLTSRFSKNQP